MSPLERSRASPEAHIIGKHLSLSGHTENTSFGVVSSTCSYFDAFRHVDTSKAHGEDGITGSVYRQYADPLSHVFSQLDCCIDSKSADPFQWCGGMLHVWNR